MVPLHLACAFLPLLSAPQGPPEFPRVLIVTGANNHDWQWTTPSLAQILLEGGRFRVETTDAPAEFLADAERANAYDAFVLDYNGPLWGEPAQSNFIRAVEAGAGAVIIHAADNNGRGWPAYEELVGDLWREGTGHGSFHAFDVDIVDRDHPVTRSLPSILMHPDELYHRLVHVDGVERRALATAYSDPSTGGTGEHEPMILVGNRGKGRVFHTPLGHVWKNVPGSQASHRDPQFRGLVVIGTEWAATGTVWDERSAPRELTDAERRAGWRSLSDRSAWEAIGGGDVPEGWAFEGETIRRTAQAGDIVTRELFEDFVLEFQWKTTIAGNSGLKYRVPSGERVGPEFQLLDPRGEGADTPKTRAGALYHVAPATEEVAGSWGEYHNARIVARGEHLEHWLDGELVMEIDRDGDGWAEALAASKFAGNGGFAAPEPGRLLLQDHGDEVWIRGLRILPIDAGAAPAQGKALFGDAPLEEGWTNVGDATYALEDGVLVGRAGPQRKQSFLVSRAAYGDFELEVDVRIATLGNSGVQFRSHVRDGRLRGYQMEIDPTDRRWSGGIYDEGRRGWLDDLSDSDEARAAFDLEGWNRYRIVAEGPWLRTWVNGVPAADLLDGLDLSGAFAFQVHGGDDDIVMNWKDARIVERGAHRWVAAEGGTAGDGMGVRLRLSGDGARLHLAHPVQDRVETVDPTTHAKWHAGGQNTVIVVWNGERCSVQVNDSKAIATFGFRPAAVTAEGGASNWERCVAGL